MKKKEKILRDYEHYLDYYLRHQYEPKLIRDESKERKMKEMKKLLDELEMDAAMEQINKKSK